MRMAIAQEGRSGGWWGLKSGAQGLEEVWRSAVLEGCLVILVAVWKRLCKGVFKRGR
jgi:hypothetical protein